jgi:hypothetical protein
MSRRKRKTPGTTGWHSDNQRIELVTTWLATGNMALTAATLQIPLPTATRWKAQPWFKTMVEDIRNEENLALDAKLSKVVNKSVEALLDRVENGDFQFDQREGRMIRKPISARDASTVTRDMIDRRALLQGQKTKEKENERQVADTLVKLAEEFSKFASNQKIKEIKGETFENV